MKRILFIFLSFLWTHPLWGYAGDRWVTVADDSLYREGTLRTVLHSSCEDEGDDRIRFERTRLSEIRIVLNEPLVIPQNCRGRVTVMGSEEVETILDGSRLTGGGSAEGDSCLWFVYSNNHLIRNFTFMNNSLGAGVCVFGRENQIRENRFGNDRAGLSGPVRYGIVLSNHFASETPGMDGGSNQIIQNVIAAGSLHSIFSQADGNIMETNRIESPSEMGIVQLGNGARIRLNNQINNTGQIGIFLEGNDIRVEDNQILSSRSSGIRLQGNNSFLGRNRIENAQEDGIRHLGDHNQISGNVISNAGWSGIALDGNDVTVNERNEITGSHGSGIAGRGSLFTINDNIINSSQVHGISCEGNNMTLRNNDIMGSIRNGIHGQLTQSFIQENRITGSQENGISLAGSGTEVSTNHVLRSSKNGFSLEGESFLVSGNEILSNGWSGIRLRAINLNILRNRIVANGGCPEDQRLASQTVECFIPAQRTSTGGPGILIEAGSHDIVVGGDSFERDKNIIQYNRDGGVIILGDATSEHHKITHNTISRNYGAEPDLDLLGDGITWNDVGDPDEGPNHLLNFIDSLQAFPLVPSLTGEARYWTWGLARHGSSVELYGVPEDDRGRSRTHGGGEIFFGESPIARRSFRIPPHVNFNSLDDQLVTALSFDEAGNTSEFSTNVMAGRDDDLDGIVNSRETGDGTLAATGSAPRLTDSDSDGLPDPVEDVNRNGRWDRGDRSDGETSAYSGDSDGDGLGDWAETHGDGIYDAGSDADPLNPDTDGDGIRDGDEDTNGNGIWENYSGESSPLLIDSDNDGIVDGRDNCRSIVNPGQEPWMCGR